MMGFTDDESERSTCTLESSPYQSCIVIDGNPILPPIMTDAKRLEMARYKEMAIEREAKRRAERGRNDKKQSLKSIQAIERMSIEEEDDNEEDKKSDLIDFDNVNPPLLMTSPRGADFPPEKPANRSLLDIEIDEDIESVPGASADIFQYSEMTPTKSTSSFLEELIYDEITTESTTLNSQHSEVAGTLVNTRISDSSSCSSQGIQSEQVTPAKLSTTSSIVTTPLSNKSKKDYVDLSSISPAVSNKSKKDSVDLSSISPAVSNKSKKDSVDLSSISPAVSNKSKKDAVDLPNNEEDIINNNNDMDMKDLDKEKDQSKSFLQQNDYSFISEEEDDEFPINDENVFKSFGKEKPKANAMLVDHSPVSKYSPISFLRSPQSRSNYNNSSNTTDSMINPMRLSFGGNYPRLNINMYDPNVRKKFDKLAGFVKGYLTRRILKTEKVRFIKQTIGDSTEMIISICEEQRNVGPKEGNANLNKMLLHQLNTARSSFHDIFFKMTPAERMSIISLDREKLRDRALKQIYPGSPSKRYISQATQKSLERRMSQLFSKNDSSSNEKVFLSPKLLKKQNRDKRESTTSSDYFSRGAQSARGKQVKSYIVTPKRRRMTIFGVSSTKPKRTSSPTKQYDQNGNQKTSKGNGPLRTQYYGRSTYTSSYKTDYFPPSSANSRHNTSQSSQTSNSNVSASGRNSNESGQNSSRFSIGSNPTSNRSTYNRTKPWK